MGTFTRLYFLYTHVDGHMHIEQLIFVDSELYLLD